MTATVVFDAVRDVGRVVLVAVAVFLLVALFAAVALAVVGLVLHAVLESALHQQGRFHDVVGVEEPVPLVPGVPSIRARALVAGRQRNLLFQIVVEELASIEGVPEKRNHKAAHFVDVLTPWITLALPRFVPGQGESLAAERALLERVVEMAMSHGLLDRDTVVHLVQIVVLDAAIAAVIGAVFQAPAGHQQNELALVGAVVVNSARFALQTRPLVARVLQAMGDVLLGLAALDGFEQNFFGRVIDGAQRVVVFRFRIGGFQKPSALALVGPGGGSGRGRRDESLFDVDFDIEAGGALETGQSSRVVSLAVGHRLLFETNHVGFVGYRLLFHFCLEFGSEVEVAHSALEDSVALFGLDAVFWGYAGRGATDAALPDASAVVERAIRLEERFK